MGRVVKMLFQILSLLLAFLQYFQVDCSWNFSSSFLHSTHLCLPEQRAVLLEFKNTISLDDFCNSYPKTNSWNESSDCCSWEGVNCNKVTGHVIGIDLSDSCLLGSLVANNSLFHLQDLQYLDLSFNWFSGSLLENGSLFHLQGLQELNLAHNDFNGFISSELFSQFVSLTHLNLSYSGFSDLIPYEISLLSNLVSLDLSINRGLRFDAQGFDMLVRNLTKLRHLVLEDIDMSGVAVTSFLDLTSYLERLSLSSCQLNGELPSEVFSLPYLQHMDLGVNEYLRGYLPKTNLSSAFELLDLHYCDFRGSIPASFGNLTHLIYVDFSFTSFEGQIPDVFGDLNKLTYLDFHSCNFSGQVPITMFNLTQLSNLYLSYNWFEGTLPTHVSQLQLLEYFWLSSNLISGGVPSWLFTLPSLIVLDLSYNKLTGPIDQFQRPNSILVIDLSSNDIHGPIPSCVFDLVNLRTLHLSSNNLSGVIKSNMLLKLKNLHELDLSNNRLLSLSRSGNDVNYSFPQLVTVSFSSCSIRQFPNFFRTSRLKLLDLSNNKISGAISKLEAEGWEYLKALNLSYNFLTNLEQFPGKNLEVLDLGFNLLRGPILSTCLNPQIPNPPQFLSFFLISENKLTGNIPSLICNWSSLTVLDLSKNSLSGTIPECLGNFSNSLKFMNLQMNNFYGKIPDSFMNNLLRDLFLNDNQLEGSLPRSLSNCSSLEVLNLGNNKLIDTFPHWLASLPSLQVLILQFNRLYGSMSNSLASCNFSALRIIDVSRNELTGPLPTKFLQNLRAMKDAPKEMKNAPKEITSDSFYGIQQQPKDNGKQRERWRYEYPISVNVTTKRLEIELVRTLAIFTTMDFSNNLFCGQIPEELGELISLQGLNFSHNNFTGSIPPSLGNLVALESLDLSSNKLGGSIPSQLTNLTFLEVLDLSENDLVGPIPHGYQFDTFDNDSYSGNLGLCGLPLSKHCGKGERPKPPAPLFVEHKGFAIPFIWKVAMMGYGCGVVLGLSMGYIVFTTGRPWWFVRMIERDLQNNVTKWICRNGGRKNH